MFVNQKDGRTGASRPRGWAAAAARRGTHRSGTRPSASSTREASASLRRATPPRLPARGLCPLGTGPWKLFWPPPRKMRAPGPPRPCEKRCACHDSDGSQESMRWKTPARGPGRRVPGGFPAPACLPHSPLRRPLASPAEPLSAPAPGPRLPLSPLRPPLAPTPTPPGSQAASAWTSNAARPWRTRRPPNQMKAVAPGLRGF